MHMFVSLLAAASFAQPHVLASGKGWVERVAQDGNRIAWATPFAVKIRAVSGGRAAWFPHRDPYDCCEDLVLGGERALWATVGSGNDTYEDVLTGSVDSPSVALLHPARSGTQG